MKSKKMLYVDTNLSNATFMVNMINSGHWMPQFKYFDFEVHTWEGRRSAFLIGFHEDRTVVIEPSDWSWKVFRAASKTNFERNCC